VIQLPGIQALRADRSAQAAAAAPAAATGADAPVDPKIVEAAKGMEGIFMSMLVNEMFKGTDLAGGQSGYGGLITEKFGDALADSGGLGLQSILVRQLSGAS
jgi:Rod binding domain-containing protein